MQLAALGKRRNEQSLRAQCSTPTRSQLGRQHPPHLSRQFRRPHGANDISTWFRHQTKSSTPSQCHRAVSRCNSRRLSAQFTQFLASPRRCASSISSWHLRRRRAHRSVRRRSGIPVPQHTRYWLRSVSSNNANSCSSRLNPRAHRLSRNFSGSSAPAPSTTSTCSDTQDTQLTPALLPEPYWQLRSNVTR